MVPKLFSLELSCKLRNCYAAQLVAWEFKAGAASLTLGQKGDGAEQGSELAYSLQATWSMEAHSSRS